MAKLDQIEIDDTLYEVVPEIAPLFNTFTAYAVGDCVIKDAVFYRFKTAHAAGAWIGTDAEAIEVGKELTDLKQDCNNVPPNKVSVHLDAVRKHNGVLLKPSISDFADKFVALILQYDCYFYRNGNTRPNTYCVAAELYVPREYWYRFRCGTITVRKRDNTELITLETPNATISRSSALINNGGTLYVNMGFNESDYDETNKYTSQRCFIELYTDENKTTLERVIYADQINFEYISTNPFTMNVERTYIEIDDVITLGFYTTSEDACNQELRDPINNDYSNFPMLSNVSGGQAEVKEQHASYLYPYVSTSRRVFAALRFGHNSYCLSNPVDIHAPDTTMKVAVSSGDTFMLDGLWYKATTDLAVGDTLVLGTNCEAVDDPVMDTTQLKQELQEFPNGNYPNMTAGNADQLVSTVFIEDEVPYNFRTSGGSADIGDREYDEIVGVSMPINQLVADNNKSYTNTLTDARDHLQLRYVVAGSTVFRVIDNVSSATVVEKIISAPATGSGLFRHNGSTQDFNLARNIPTIEGHKLFVHIKVISADPTTVGGSVTDNQMCFDLTQMLGTTIADYVYSLETATAGSGVTWLKHHFPKIFDSGYIPYNAGEMQSVSGLSLHRMTGFNQWDGTYEQGKWISDYTTGEVTAAQNDYSVTDFIPVLPNTVYYKHETGSSRAIFYDGNKNAIPMTSWAILNAPGTITSPSNARYIRFTLTTSYLSTFCINLHWDGERDGEYEEYKEYEYALDDSVVLRGKLELDSNNNLRANGDRYLPDGTVQRNWAEVDLGNLTWSYQESTGRFIGYISNIDKPSASNMLGNIICDKYVTVTNTQTHSTDKTIGVSQYGDIAVKDTSYGSDAVAFKTGVTGNKLTYKLATPTTETAEPYQTPQIVDDWGTEEYISTSLVPVGHYTKYANNLRAKLEMAPESPAGNGDYIVRQTNGQNEYVALGSTTTIQGILDRLTALENA